MVIADRRLLPLLEDLAYPFRCFVFGGMLGNLFKAAKTND